MDKRIEMFRKVVAETLKEIDGAAIEDFAELEELIKKKLREKATFCKFVGAVAEPDESELHVAVAITTIFCDELSTEIIIPLKLAVATKDIKESSIRIDVDEWKKQS